MRIMGSTPAPVSSSLHATAVERGVSSTGRASLWRLTFERFLESIQAPVVWTVGALFDFVVGTQRRAPAWFRHLHMEWLWRLGTAPGRLGGRYIIGNPLFLLRVMIQRIRDPAS